MTEREPVDPLGELRASNPVDPGRLPSASLARVDAKVRKEIASEERRRKTGARRAPALALLSGAVVALVVATVALRGAPGGTVTPPPSGPVANASCVEQYSLTTLGNRQFAFDGTVTAVSGDTVTLTVNTPFRGVASSSVTLEAPGITGTTITSAGSPMLVVGERYLVAGDDRFVWGCGFTQPYDHAVASAWADALAR